MLFGLHMPDEACASGNGAMPGAADRLKDEDSDDEGIMILEGHHEQPATGMAQRLVHNHSDVQQPSQEVKPPPGDVQQASPPTSLPSGMTLSTSLPHKASDAEQCLHEPCICCRH